MPKKSKKNPVVRTSRANKDFFFLLVVSVFSILTIFAASYIGSEAKSAQASQKVKSLDVAPLYVVK